MRMISVPAIWVVPTTRSDSSKVNTDEKSGPRVGSGRGTGTATAVAPGGSAKAEIQEVVFVIKNGKAVLTPVKTGISDFQNIQILTGVQAGEQVASGPFRAVAKSLKDGANVEIKDAKSLNKEALKEDAETAN